MPTAALRNLQAVLLSAAVVAAAGCGRDAQTVATGPTPSVASSPTPAGGADEVPPVATVTAEAATVTPEPATTAS
ncbi:MAG TPA: hypothetical protein VMZ00_07235, partial [Sporichthya sp.]|nr:hypothetical protein [Sporichthya sp.]